MFIRRFVFFLVFPLLAVAGETGAVLESFHQDEERCLICENAARPATKISSTRNIRPLKEIADERQIARDEFLKKTDSCRNLSVTNPPPAAHFRILLI